MIETNGIKEYLKSKGVRITPQRLYVVDMLLNSTSPNSALELHKKMLKKGHLASQASVYRTLKLFESLGLVDKDNFQDGEDRYKISLNHAHHMLCRDCGDTVEIKGKWIEKIENLISSQRKYDIEKHSIEFFGHCHSCK